MRKRTPAIYLAAAVIMLLLFIPGCGKKAEPPKPTPTATPTPVPHIEKIVYTRNGNLFWMNIDGTVKEEIFRDNTSKWFPSVSPDGWYIAYWVQSSNDTYNLWVGDFKKRKAFQVTFDEDGLDGDIQNFSFNNTVSWDKDSANVVYSRHKDIWKMDREGYNQEAITESHNNICPTISKENILVYVRFDNETTANLYMRRIDDKNDEKITNLMGAKASSPVLSPDGTMVVYSVVEKDSVNVYLIDLKAKTEKQLTFDGRSFSPSFSHNGSEIIFASSVNDKYQPDIWKMSTDGNDRIKITTDGGVCPSWLYRITAEFPPTATPTIPVPKVQGQLPTAGAPAPVVTAMPQQQVPAQEEETLFEATPTPAVEQPVIRSGAIKTERKGDRLIFYPIIHFDSGRAEVKNEFYPVLDDLAAAVKKYKKSPIIVEGHTDNVPIRSKIYKTNMALSLARAKSVRQYFVTKHTIDSKRIQIKGYGAVKPIDTNDTEEGKYKNRRTEIVLVIITGDVEEATPTPTATPTMIPTSTPTPTPTPKLNFFQKLLKPAPKAPGVKGGKW